MKNSISELPLANKLSQSRYHKEDCQFIYKKLLHLSRPNIKDNNLTQFQATLSETTNCDYISDFTKMRERFANESQPPSANESQPPSANTATSNNRAQLHAQLKSALTARNRMEYEYGTFYANIWRVYDDIFRN
jgi:hypothetical protein